MLSGSEKLSGKDSERLAALHTAILPASLVSRLGLSYARAFYRYVAVSPHEVLTTERGGDGRIMAGCVVSHAMGSFKRRLLWSTPLLPAAVLRLPVIIRALGSGGPVQEPQEIELLMLFTDPNARGQGAATRLVQRAETDLIRRGIGKYVVRTFDDPGDPAYKFYIARGFEHIDSFSSHGSRFALMRRTLAA